MLAVSIIWIVIGIIYIIYQAFEDYPRTSVSLFMNFFLPMFVFMGVAVVLVENNLEVAGQTIGLSFFIVWIPYRIWKCNKIIVMEQMDEKRKEKFEKWKSLLRENGHPYIRDEDIELLINHPHSPLNKEKLRVTSEELYEWLCMHYSGKLESMSDKRLEKLIGVPMNSMPKDENLRPYYAKEKLRDLIIIKILKEQYGGLMYIRWSHARVIYSENDEYVSKVYSFIRDYNKHGYNSEHH